MAVNTATIELIKRNEGCVLYAYPDPATGGDPWTIGYGHTGPDVYPGLRITQEQAEALLRKDLEKFEQGVAHGLKRPANPNQFGAMVSLAYNVGLGFYPQGEGLKPTHKDHPKGTGFRSSSVRRYHNEGNYARAAASFAAWNKAAGKVMAGLTRRRGEERALYQTVAAEEAMPNAISPIEKIKAIQLVLGVEQDGDLGRKSRAALNAILRAAGQPGV
jgi:lysozyme